MKIPKIILVATLLLLATVSNFAQESPKHELRATWIATVDKIDWPKSNVASTQKTELISIFDKLEIANMNSAFFQVRPMTDALYKSRYEPWSHYLTGTRGKDPGYDPLTFAVEEAHKRGIEIHAWINPYRYETNKMNHGSEDYVRKNHPEWILTYTDRRILDPGNPEVRQYIINIIEDIITNYNVDGIIFDDYYYPYSGTTTEDSYSQGKYKDPAMNVGDWRRESVNQLIAGIYAKIQEVKSTVKFSQGPFGIWGANKAVADKYGIDYINTSGGTDAYGSIYCDAVGWVKDKIVDFISPQCYWPSTSTKTWGYKTLVPWWSGVAEKMDRHFYSSMRMGTMGTRSIAQIPANIDSLDFEGLSNLEKMMISSSEISLRSAATDEGDLEIDLNRSANKQDAPGHVFFNTTQFFGAGFHTHLKATKFALPALTPTMTWKTPTELAPITQISIGNNILSWASDVNESDKFAIYLIPNELTDNPESYSKSTYLKKITWSKTLNVTQYASLLATHKFAITVIDGHGYESQAYREDVISIIENDQYRDYHVRGGRGYIEIDTERPVDIAIYSTLGQKINTLKINELTKIPSNSGVYIVNGRKVIVQ